MANGQQIATSVTILNSLLGYQAISLTDFSTSALSNIAAGSKVEIASAFFNFATDCIPNASSWTAITTATTAYLALTPSGTAGSQVVSASWTSTAPVWSTSKQGYYTTAASNIRVVASVYKVSSTQQSKKIVSTNIDKYNGIIEMITSGSGTWVVPFGVTRIKVICVGGGGGGGGGSNGGYAGGGGGSGTIISQACINYLETTPGTSFSYSVGTGGSGGSAGAAGGTGGSTIFGTITCLGGLGGYSSGGSTPYMGGSAPSVIGGDAGVNGNAFNNSGPTGFGGKGGGAGGRGGYINVTNGHNGDYGGGGGGGGSNTSGSTSGGNGGSGIIIIEY